MQSYGTNIMGLINAGYSTEILGSPWNALTHWILDNIGGHLADIWTSNFIWCILIQKALVLFQLAQNENIWTLVCEIGWRITSDWPLSEPIVVQFSVAHVRHQVSASSCTMHLVIQELKQIYLPVSNKQNHNVAQMYKVFSFIMIFIYGIIGCSLYATDKILVSYAIESFCTDWIYIVYLYR